MQKIVVCLFFYVLKALFTLKLGLFPNAKVSQILKDLPVEIIFSISFPYKYPMYLFPSNAVLYPPQKNV